jgi:hypothetical protein
VEIVNLYAVHIRDHLREVCLAAPSSVKCIGEWSFYDCDIRSLEFPDCVEVIGSGASSFYEHLSSISFGSALRLLSIDEHAFEMSGLKSFHLPALMETVSANSFINTPIETIRFNDHLKRIGCSAFSSCRLSRAMAIPDKV